MKKYSIRWGRNNMDPIKTLGTLLPEDEDRRDAIHIAIMPVILAEDMSPGDRVGFIYGSREIVKRKDDDESIGVIDPFLKGYLEKDSKVWMFLYPNTVTGMRHQWSHPGVDEPHVTKSASEDWLHQFAEKWNFNYGEMISQAQVDEGMIVANGIDLHGAGELGGDEDLFWHHIELLTGKKFDGVHREKFCWSCSC